MANSAKHLATVEGSSKTWANLDGTGTIALRDSFNIASAVDNGPGDYTFNYSNVMASAGYSSSVTGHDATGSNNGIIGTGKAGTAPTSSAYRVSTTASTGFGPFDVSQVNFSVLGDLA